MWLPYQKTTLVKVRITFGTDPPQSFGWNMGLGEEFTGLYSPRIVETLLNLKNLKPKMENYNQGDEVVVLLPTYGKFNAQVFKDNGKSVHIIVKENLDNEYSWMYDREFDCNKICIVSKTYDSITDTMLCNPNI